MFLPILHADGHGFQFTFITALNCKSLLLLCHQGVCRAGAMLGLQDSRTGLIVELYRIMDLLPLLSLTQFVCMTILGLSGFWVE